MSKIFERALWVPQAPLIKMSDFKKSAVLDLWGIFFHRYGIAANAVRAGKHSESPCLATRPPET